VAHAKAIRTPSAFHAIRNVRATDEIALYGFKASRWRRFDQLPKFPDGLLPVGDTVCRFNPVYGQGMSVASQEAVLLHRLLSARSKDGGAPDNLARSFFQEAQATIETPWWGSAVPDFLDLRTEGERPPDLANRLNFSAALFRLAVEDAGIQQILIEVQHLIRPQSALREPALVDRVKTEMASRSAANA